MTTRRCSLCALLLLLGGPSAVQAAIAEQDPFEAQYQRGLQAFYGERYAEALDAFQAAYHTRPIPKLLVHIGTVHRKLGQAAQALEAYRAYLRLEPHPPPAMQAKLRTLLAETEALLPGSEPRGPWPEPPVARGRSGPPRHAAAPERSARTRDRQPRAPAPPLARFTPLAPLPTRAPISALAVGGRQELWAAAGSGVFRHDGQGWTTSYADWSAALEQADASADLHRIWRGRDGQLWAVGEGGLVLVYDGRSWHALPTGHGRDLLCGLEYHGQLQVLDAEGGVLQLEGTDWVPLETGWTRELELSGCHVFEEQALYAVGAHGLIVRWDGTRQTGLVSGTIAPLAAIWGSSERDLWAAGGQGTLLRFDGQRWQAAEPPRRDRTLRGLWGSGPNDIWAVGGNFEYTTLGGIQLPGEPIGAIWHFDGQRWSDAVGDVPGQFRAVGGHGPRDVHVLGAFGHHLHFDGESWDQPPETTGDAPNWIWARAPDELWAVGDAGTILHQDGAGWNSRHTRTPSQLHALWRHGPDDVWAAGDRGTLLHFDGRGWTRAALVTSDRLGALWAPGPEELFVGGRGRIFHRAGPRWSVQPLPDRDTTVQALAGRTVRDLWAAGDGCRVYRYDGRAWSREATAQLPRLDWPGGRNPLTPWQLTFPRAKDAPPPAPTQDCRGRRLRQLLLGPHDRWAAGPELLLRHTPQGWGILDGSWSSWQEFSAIWGNAAGELWFAASTPGSAPEPRPGLLHFDGRRWRAWTTTAAVTVLASGDGQLWAGLADGTVGVVRDEE